MRYLMIITGIISFLGLLAGIMLRMNEVGHARTVLLADLVVWVIFMVVAFAFFYKRLKKKHE